MFPATLATGSGLPGTTLTGWALSRQGPEATRSGHSVQRPLRPLPGAPCLGGNEPTNRSEVELRFRGLRSWMHHRGPPPEPGAKVRAISCTLAVFGVHQSLILLALEGFGQGPSSNTVCIPSLHFPLTRRILETSQRRHWLCLLAQKELTLTVAPRRALCDRSHAPLSFTRPGHLFPVCREPISSDAGSPLFQELLALPRFSFHHLNSSCFLDLGQASPLCC